MLYHPKSANRLAATKNTVLGPAMLALATALALGATGCGRGSAQGGQHAEEVQKVPAPRTVAATAREIPVTLALDGTLLADEDSNLASVVSGRVNEVLVERGAVVHQGDPLIKLRDTDFRIQVRSAQAALNQARARLGIEQGGSAGNIEELAEVRSARSSMELAEASLTRAQAVSSQGAVSAQQLDEYRQRAEAAREQYRAALNNARAQLGSLESAQAQLAQASTSAAESIIRAPFDGEVSDRNVSVGEFVAPQTALLTLVRTNPLRLEVQVPQQQLRYVRTGLPVTIRVDARPDETFQGSVRYVSASIRRDSRGLVVEAVVPNDNEALRPGMFAQARIDTGTTQTVAIVPPTAVLEEAGVARVFVIKNNRVEERVVSIHDRNDREIFITDGLTAGENVAVERLDALSDGAELGPAAASAPAAAQ